MTGFARPAAALSCALLLAAGCGGHAATNLPQDAALQTAADSGRQSLDFGRLKQAAGQYQEAYKLALARDDARAIGVTGYNLAVVQLAANDAAGALSTSLRTRDALVARGIARYAELDLVEAAVLHRLSRDQDADLLAARAQATADDPAVRARASYVRGLIADTHGDAAGMTAALAGFGQPKQPSADWQADFDEITARLYLLRGECGKAAILARHVADIHRAQLDYRAMADTLALAARAAQCGGASQEAADFYLQAGESTASQGDNASAARWAKQALRSGASPATRRAATKMLAALRRSARS